MQSSGDEDDETESAPLSSAAGESAPRSSAAGNTGNMKPKVWRQQAVQEYIDNLLILSALEIVEGGAKMRACEIHYELFSRFHGRVANAKEHKRPDELLHPLKLLEVTAFKSQQQWKAWIESDKFGTGKASAADPDSGLLSEEHAEWASKKWEKYKILKREIHDSVQKIWIGLIPNNVLPSGIKLAEKVEQLRSKMFDVWKFAKTSNQSKTKYADQQMTGPCANWHPTWWTSWLMMGPAGVKCSATFMSEVGMKIETVVQPMPLLLENHFGSNYEANVLMQSRRSLKKESQVKAKLEYGTTALPATPASSGDGDAVLSRVRSMDTKALLDVRRHEIQRLQFLVASPLASPAEQLAYHTQLFQFMKNPVMTDFSGSFRSSPVFIDSRESAAEDSTSTLSSLMIKKFDAFGDAAESAPDDSQPTFSAQPRILPSLLQVTTPQHDDLATPFDYDEVENSVLQGNALPQDAVEFESEEVLWILANPTKGNGACCPIAIFESLRHNGISVPGITSPHLLREALVDWIQENSDAVTHELLGMGGLSFREAIRSEYILGRRELRDSDYIRAAHEADPEEDPVQTVNTFFSYLQAMRKRNAYGDEFFVAAAAVYFECQIVVARKFSEIGNGWKPYFYSSPSPQSRLFLCAEHDHYEWCFPDNNHASLLKRIAIIHWNPLPLASKQSNKNYDDNAAYEIESFETTAGSFFDCASASTSSAAVTKAKSKPASTTIAASAAAAMPATNAQDSAAVVCAHQGTSDATSSAAVTKAKPNMQFASLSPEPPVKSPEKMFKVCYNPFFEVRILPCIMNCSHICSIVQATESLATITWPDDIERRDTGGPAGRGIFSKKHIASGACVAAYWGHLVDAKGLIIIKCEATTNLLTAVPDARRPFSKAHAVSLMQQPCNLFVDGSHHTGSKYDRHRNRNGIPWGALLNSSQYTGVAANCELRFLPSPAFESIREASRKLGNGNNTQVGLSTHSHTHTLILLVTHLCRDSCLPDAKSPPTKS